mgnify:CR=1 FL=1
MPAQLSTFDAVLKDDYHGPVVEQLNQKNMFAAQIDKDTENFVGRKWIQPLHVTRNTGVGAGTESSALPTAGNQGFVDIVGPIRMNRGQVRLTTAVIESASKDRGSFVRALETEMNGLVNDLSRDECRQTWGEANGRLATCGTTTASTTVTLAATTSDAQLRWIEDRGVVDIGVLATPTSITTTSRTVSSVNYSAKTFVISGAAVTTSAAAFVFASGSGGASSNSGTYNDGQFELTGLQTMVDDTAVLHTVNPATVSKWKAQKYTTVGSISESLLVKYVNETEIASGMTPDLIVGAYGVTRAIGNLLTSQKRVLDNVSLKGGWSATSLDAVLAGGKGSYHVAMVPEKNVGNGVLYGLNTKAFKQFVLKDWGWMDSDGAVLSRVANTPAYEATMEKFSEFVCTQRNANFVASGITEA